MATKINRPHPNTKAKFPAGLIDVEIVGNSRDVQTRLMGLETAMTSTILAADFLGRRVHDNLRDRAEERFRTEGDAAVGGKWADLRPYTIEQRGGSAHPINERTGKMKRYVLDPDADVVPMGAFGAAMWFPARNPGAELTRKMKVAQIGKMRDKVSGATVPRPVLGLDIGRDLEMTLVSLALHFASYQPDGAAFFGV